TSGERVGERGTQIKMALLSPTLSSLCGEERENSSLHRRFYSLIQWQWGSRVRGHASSTRCENPCTGSEVLRKFPVTPCPGRETTDAAASAVGRDWRTQSSLAVRRVVALPEGIVPERSLWGAAKNSLKVGGAAPAKCYRPPGSGFHRALICVAPIYGIDLSSCCCLSSAVGLSS